jgi:NAD(P)-dependent dehydrogenase (short-subunit alcohol dehydrogenase family)
LWGAFHPGEFQMADSKSTAQSRVVLITGAGSGIGRAVAETFIRNGDHVVLAGRRADALQETVNMATGSAEHTLTVPTDIADPAQVQALFDATIARFGRLDVVFNNAGIGAPAVDVDELALEQWKAVVDTNLNGVFYCIRNAFRVMKAQSPMGGRIINNGSISAHAPRPNSAPYTSTKHAVTGLTKAAALDGRKYNIAAGQIDIGNALTPLAAKMATGVPQADGRIMAEAVMDVGEVARAVFYMASLPPEANVLTMTVMATKMPFVGRG